MTVVALLADPPREGVSLPMLSETAPLSAAESVELYAAMLEDAMRTVIDSGGELIVNYRPDELLPEDRQTGESVEPELRGIAATATDAVDEIRFEPQVGSTPSARVGNTITHLLEEHAASSAAVLRLETPLLARRHIDSAAMKLRRDDVVLGPATDGRLYFAGFGSPIDFEHALESQPLETMTTRAADAGLSTEFLSMQPLVERGSDLATLLPMVRARLRADRRVPAATTAALEALDLSIEPGEGWAAGDLARIE
jgi:hypothetical protein